MRMLIILLCLISATVSYGQQWTELDNSPISYINPATLNDTINRDNNFGCYYFKKDSVLIGIPQRFFSRFINLFQQAPSAFDSLIEYSFWGFDKSQVSSRAYDTVLFLLNFNKAVIFFNLTVRYTKEGMIWVLENRRFDKPIICYNEIHFKRMKHGKTDKFLFKSVSNHACEI